MSIPIRIGRKWLGRTRKTGFPSVSENFDSYEDANNFAIKTKASMLSLKHNGVRDVRKMTIGSLIDGYMEEHEGVPFGKNKTAVLKTLKRDLGDILVPHFTVDRVTTYIKARKKAGADGVTISIGKPAEHDRTKLNI